MHPYPPHQKRRSREIILSCSIDAGVCGVRKMTTKELLAQAMESEGCPANLISRARGGEFDDFESNSATPIVRLVNELSKLGFPTLAARAIDGEFDSTKEEAEEWFKREGQHLL